MSTPEESAPLDAAPPSTSPQTDAAPAEPLSSAESTVSANQSQAQLHDALSPAVRRLVRQFDLDITGIHGSGPEGRIRVGDVMSLLAGRTDTGNRDAPVRAAEPDDLPEEPLPDDDGPQLASVVGGTPALGAGPAARTSGAITTVFDCDMSRVSSHRKGLRDENVEVLTTSYVLTALAAALDGTPEITGGTHPRFGVSLTTVDGEQRSAFLDTATVAWDIAVDARVRAFDEALRANLDADVTAANLLVHHYGESGSLLATPTPIGAGHAASVGVGRVRREIVVRTVDGVEAPRVAARCYLTLSFLPSHVSLEHANRALAETVRILEGWDR
jgi:2-oxoglutarate dehydrogenase E2 component (dihydrolipoamide succinyltransferase)